jgi:hypothetical protein
MLFSALHPALIMIFADLYWYALDKYNIDLVITDTISTVAEDKKLKRTSSSHRNSIAIDFRANNIDAFILSDLVTYINSKPEYRIYHYLSHSGIKRLAYVHDNTNGYHCHMALHSRFAL